MVCKTLTVGAQLPAVNVDSNTVTFAKGGVAYESPCTAPNTDIGQPLQVKCNVQVERARANFRLFVVWMKDGVSQQASLPNLTQDVGITTWTLSLGVNIASGNYTNLNVQADQVISA